MSDKRLLIHVGSASAHKIAAVRGACEELGLDAEIVGMKTASGVNEQPNGLRETRLGARNRAERAWADGPRTPDLAVGIESGIVGMGQADDGRTAPVFDFACAVVRAPMTLRFHALSAGHEIHPADADEAQSRGFDKHTAGSVTAERTGCDQTDATPHYTGGRVTRAELLRQAVKIALSQWLAWRDRIMGRAPNTETAS